ncbi:MAG: GGDEF domain-containing protein [Christensenellales bacterium]
MIQTLGVFIIIIVVFLIPNLWSNMIMVAVIITAGFFLSAYFNIENLNQTQMIAGIVYLLIEIVLCAIFAFYFNRYQRGEYSTKTELQRIYATDPLTQVGNRIRLEDEAEKWLEFCSRHHLPLSLVLVDVDNMKQINDQYGHLAGDVILYEMAQIMYTQLRKNDVCARWGGDEFILLLPYTNLDEAKSLTERIREAISKYKFNINIDTTCSFGIVSMKEGLNLGQLIKQADALMYMAKKSGKDNIEINAQVQSHFDE